jgi:heme oxygenase
MLLSHATVVPAAERVAFASGYIGALPQAAKRTRSDALRNDLDAFGLTSPDPADVSFLNSRGGVAGLLYVLEGSRLGAAVIRRRLAQSGASFPTSFLSHGEGSGHWPSFLGWLNSTQWSDSELVDMRDNAIALFELYLTTAEALLPANGQD